MRLPVAQTHPARLGPAVADRRLVAQSITDSGQVFRLIARCGPWAGLLLTWSFPFVDDDGRLDGDPDALRSMVLRRYTTKVSEEDVAEFLATMNDLDLVVWYEVIEGGDRYLYFPRFGQHQGLRADRYVPSRRPAPPKWIPDETHPYTKQPELRKTKPQRDSRATRRVGKRRDSSSITGSGAAAVPPDLRHDDDHPAPDSCQPDNQDPPYPSHPSPPSPLISRIPSPNDDNARAKPT